MRRHALATLLIWAFATPAVADPDTWRIEWPETDFSKHAIPFAEIRSVIAKDGIPAIDRPTFVPIAEQNSIAAREPVISVSIGAEARAYPLRILIWHEIVNDEIGSVPVAVTFCPLCNSAVVFERRLEGRTLDFGVTGKLRNSDLIMYDRQTHSWWQQFTGQGLVGAMAGKQLKFVQMRMESVERFRARHPNGKILVPANAEARRYGQNPYPNYDQSASPFLFDGPLPKNVPPLERVVVVDGRAWSFGLLKKRRRVEDGDLVITWEPGQVSALGDETIASAEDVGNAVVQRRGADGKLTDAVYDVSFAFAFYAFHPSGVLLHE